VTYLALLRGVNVGGRRAVSMAAVKAIFEELGFTGVKSYINSGNVIFDTRSADRRRLTRRIEKALHAELGVEIKVLIRSAAEIEALAATIPASWVNDGDTKCDVIFLWDELDRPEILDELPHNASVDEVRYTKGAVLLRVPRALATKSKMSRLVGTPSYQLMTIRNANTVRALHGLMHR
jgi:uncharacterized protein (DUF1697 family)